MNSLSQTVKTNQDNLTLFCPKLHTLIWEGNHSVVSRKTCNICKSRVIQRGNHMVSCSGCDYDVCASCETQQQERNINSTNQFNIKCKQSHPLRQLKDDSVVRKICDICKQRVSDKGNYSMNCIFCDYDVCAKCESETQNHTQNTSNETRFKCLKNHPLNKLTDGSVVRKTCDVCKHRVSEFGNYTLNCRQCDFDVCAKCEHTRCC